MEAPGSRAPPNSIKGTRQPDLTFPTSPRAAGELCGIGGRLRYRDREHDVRSGREMDALLADLFDFVAAHPPDPLPEGWSAFLVNARTVIARAER